MSDPLRLWGVWDGIVVVGLVVIHHCMVLGNTAATAAVNCIVDLGI